MAIFLIIKGVKLFTSKDIEINRFSPHRFSPNYKEKNKFKKAHKKGPLPHKKVILIVVIGGASTGLLVYAIVGNLYISALSTFLGLLFPKLWYKWYAKNQEKLISTQVEKAAEIMSVVLRSENNLVAALEKAAFDCDEPLKSKLTKTANEIRLGIPISVAFKSLATDVSVPEMMIISVGIELQQQGMAINMANMWEQVQKNIRERQGFKDEMNVITAENRMSGWIVACIPFVTLALMRQVYPGFIAPLFNTITGLSVFFLCVATIIIGLLWLMKIANMENY